MTSTPTTLNHFPQINNSNNNNNEKKTKSINQSIKINNSIY